eukprot:Gb_18220 [translate_table: standard]
MRERRGILNILLLQQESLKHLKERMTQLTPSCSSTVGLCPSFLNLTASASYVHFSVYVHSMKKQPSRTLGSKNLIWAKRTVAGKTNNGALSRDGQQGTVDKHKASEVAMDAINSFFGEGCVSLRGSTESHSQVGVLH